MKIPNFEIFDLNVHFTVNGKFREYKRNIPSSLSNYMSAVPDYIKISGGLEVGVPNVGQYSHSGFKNLNGFSGAVKFASVTKNTIENYDGNIGLVKDLGYVGLKYHPRTFEDKFFSKVSKSLIEYCKYFDLIYGICTYENDNFYSKRYKRELRKTLDSALESKVKIILFHGCGKNFAELYALYGAQKNVFFDCSFSPLRFSYGDFLDNLVTELRMGADNVGFGSDFPDYSIVNYENMITHIHRNVQKENFIKFFASNSKNFLSINSAQ